MASGGSSALLVRSCRSGTPRGRSFLSLAEIAGVHGAEAEEQRWTNAAAVGGLLLFCNARRLVFYLNVAGARACVRALFRHSLFPMRRVITRGKCDETAFVRRRC